MLIRYLIGGSVWVVALMALVAQMVMRIEHALLPAEAPNDKVFRLLIVCTAILVLAHVFVNQKWSTKARIATSTHAVLSGACILAFVASIGILYGFPSILLAAYVLGCISGGFAVHSVIALFWRAAGSLFVAAPRVAPKTA